MPTIEAKAEILIRRPVADVFAAFVDPMGDRFPKPVE